MQALISGSARKPLSAADKVVGSGAAILGEYLKASLKEREYLERFGSLERGAQESKAILEEKRRLVSSGILSPFG